jgi:Kdo2-lipid IVA lauroyltransferase/acyltransferase
MTKVRISMKSSLTILDFDGIFAHNFMADTFKKLRRKIRYGTIYRVVEFVIFIASRISRESWISFCGALGKLAFHLAKRSRLLAIRHLTLVYGTEKSASEIKRMAKEVFEMLGKNASDVIRSFHQNDIEHYRKFLKVTGYEIAAEAMGRGKGLVFITAHIGSFELLALEVSAWGFQPYIVGEPLKDPRLNEMVVRHRSKFGGNSVDRFKDTLKIFKKLKGGAAVALLVDQDIKIKSCITTFFGMPCATPVGGTVMAMKSKAPVIPIFIHMNKDNTHEIVVYPELPMDSTGDDDRDMVVNTQRINDAIEREIRKYPTQWVWLHERWKTKPGEEIRY